MSFLEIAQFMAAASFWTIALVHFFVWVRARNELTHLLFALTSISAGLNAVAETMMYRAATTEAMCVALRWYVAASGCWFITCLLFIAVYSQVSRLGRFLTAGICVLFLIAMVANHFSPASFLYTELTSLRTVTLPWGEEFHLANGIDNPTRLLLEWATLSIFVVIFDGGVQLFRRGQPQRAILFTVAAVLFMGCFGAHAAFVDAGRLDWPYLSTYGFLALVCVTSLDLAGEVMRGEKLSTELKQMEMELQTAVADERSRIAGDLHDSVTQTLFSTAAIADALPEVWQRRPDDALGGLEDLKLLTRGALAEMRSLLLELRPDALLEKDLAELLDQLVQSTSGRTRTPIELQVEIEMELPKGVRIMLYRVTQEALNNIARHAHATKVRVHLQAKGETATLTIEDDGQGFDVNDTANAGMGLHIMNERVSANNGRLEIRSEAEMGTTVTVQWVGETRSES